MLKMLRCLCGRKPPVADGPAHPLQIPAALPTNTQNHLITSSAKGDPPSNSVPSPVPEYIRTLKAGFILLASKTEPLLGGTPFKIPIGVLNAFLDLAVTISDNKSAVEAQLQQLTRTIEVINKAMDTATSVDAKERARKFSEFLTAEMSEFEALQRRPRFAKILQSEEDAKTIEVSLKRINGQLQIFQLDVMTSIERLEFTNRMEAVLDKLHRAAASDASHDAGERFPPPRCHPATRTDILADLHDWALEDDPRSRILWLHGPAGAGKSAVAQTLCQNLEAEGHLGASFFFKRGHSTRGHATKLFPTITYHLALVLPEFKTAIMGMDNEPAALDKSLSVQLERLVMAPLQRLVPTRTMAIVIDGLDECEGENVQQEIIELIGKAVTQLHCPLRFLIVSRPESHISQIFGQPSFDDLHRKFNIHQSFDDIRAYLDSEFTRIHRDHETMVDVASPWPSQTDVEHLVDKSSGYFIYAATVIKFIDDPDFRPTERLEIVMGIAEPENGSPFSALDQLYVQILEAVPGRRQLLRILSVLAANLILSLLHIEQLLGMKTGDVRLALRRACSVVDVPLDSQGCLTTHHASFLDFLNEQKRSRVFFTGVRSIHHQKLAVDILQAFSYTNDDPSVNAIGHVAWELDPLIVTSAQPSREIFDLLRCFNPDFVFNGAYKNPDRIRNWAFEMQEAELSLPEDLIQLSEDYHFMDRCDEIWSQATKEKTRMEGEIHDVVTQTSPELIRIFHAYPLLYDVKWGQGPILYKIRQVLDLSWDKLRAIICPLRESVGDNGEELERLFVSVSHRTRIRQLHPDPDLHNLTAGAMAVMMKLTTYQLPRQLRGTAPFWGCVLRSCPPCPELLQTLSEAEEASAISDPRRPYNKGNVHNVIEWLKTFPDPSWDLIARIQDLLPESANKYQDVDDNPEEIWDNWKQWTGW
ncbi:hypothetical protein K438DRAFT_1820351 [Mycena galopus ATCC 62051]|nr:hypothetical protein K438DRAFT_1820351 [Mycena galopus ATCC 62051]